MSSRSLISLLLIASFPLASFALVYPTTTPTGETTGGTYRTYFDNIFQNAGTDCNVSGQVIGGFDAVGVPTCVTPVSSGLFLVGQQNGDTIRFDGPSGLWVRNNRIYNDGSLVGIGNPSPTYPLDVSGTARFTALRYETGAGSGKILTSDASGNMYWANSVSGATATGITGGTQNYLPKFGVGGVGLYISQLFDDGTNIGIGTTTPGAKLDVSGADILVNGLKIGRGAGNILGNTVLGQGSLAANTTGYQNTALGANTLVANTTGYENTAIGYNSLLTNTLGSQNIGIGGRTLQLNTTGTANIANGTATLYKNTIGSYNTAIGGGALYGSTTGDSNVGIGFGAGVNWVTDLIGSNNTFIGTNTTYTNASISNATAIGFGTSLSQSNTVILGNGASVGIGTSTPVAKLDVVGALRIADSTIVCALGTTEGAIRYSTTAGFQFCNGYRWINLSDYDPWSTGGNFGTTTGSFLGTRDSMDLVMKTNNIEKFRIRTTTASGNLFVFTGGNILLGNMTIGVGSLGNSASGNTALGDGALAVDVAGVDNTALGYRTLASNVGAVADIVAGKAAGGRRNTAIGSYSLTSNLKGNENIAIGYQSLLMNDMGSANTALGVGSLRSNLNGASNTAVGIGSLAYNTTGSGNSADGANALASNTTGNLNAANGYNSLINNSGGSYNTANGAFALSSNTTGDYNSALGYSAGSSSGVGSPGIYNTFLGVGSYYSIASINNATAVGARVELAQSNTVILGSGADVGIGTSTPGAKLEVAGLVKITGGTPAAGKVLTTDATGLASWQFPSTTAFVTATGITGGVESYIPKFGTGGNGLYPSLFFETGGRIGLANTNPGYTLDVSGTGNFTGFRLPTGAQSGYFLTTDTSGNARWTPNVATALTVTGQALGTTLYYNGSSWVASTNIYNSGSNIGIGAVTPGAKLEVGGQVKITGGSPGAGKILVSDATGLASWQSTTASLSGTYWSLSGNTIGSSDFIGTTNAQDLRLYTNNSQKMIITSAGRVGIGVTNPTTANLELSGSALISGDITVQGRVITDTIVNRTIANVTVSGSLLPDSGAPVANRDIGANAQRWNNLYISGQASIGGGSPGLGKILTSDATGLASWSSNFAGTMSATGITGGASGYLSVFGAGGNGLFTSLVFQTGAFIGVSTINPAYTLDVNGTGSFVGIRMPTGAGVGRILTSDATGLASWSSNFIGTTTASGITGGASGYLSVFGAGGNGLFTSLVFQTGAFIGVSTINPAYTLDVNGTGSFVGIRMPTGAAAGRVLMSDASGNAVWSATISGATATGITGGTQNYLPKFGTGGVGLYLSQFFDDGTNSAIGSITPTSKFEIWSGSTANSSLLHFRGANNIGLGLGAVKTNQTGNANVGIGNESLFTLTSGYSNTAVGYRSMRTNAAGFNNSAFGQEALYNNDGGSWNVAIGYQGLYSNTSGTGNVALGAQSLYNIATGNGNIGIGYQAGRAVAGSSISNTVALGYQALYGATASNLVGIGYQALYSNTSGTGNTAVGYSTLDSVSTGGNNTAVGYAALGSATGSNNTALGQSAGSSLTTGSNNIAIGANAQLFSSTDSNQLSIGNWIYGSGGNIGIGTGGTALTAKLTIDSGISDTSGFRIARLVATTPVFGGVAAPLGVDGSGNVVVAQQGAIPVYTALGATQNAAINTTTNPPTIGANYDKYFTINARQSFVVTDVGGNPYNCPEFNVGSTNKGATSCTATPWATYVMTAQNATSGNRYGYQILISDRTDAPFVVRGGTYDSTQGKLMNTARTIEALWFKAITVPTNHADWLYINPGVDANNNVIAGGGNVGIGTINPGFPLDVRGIIASNAQFIGNASDSVSAPSFSWSGDTNLGMYRPAADTIAFTTAGAEALRIFSNGNVTIGSTTNSDKLRVDGTVKLGTNGTQLNGILRATVTLDVPAIGASACSAQIFSVPNALTTGTATISPASALTDRMAITYARVSAAGTVEAKFCNLSAASIDLASMNYYITVIQ